MKTLSIIIIAGLLLVSGMNQLKAQLVEADTATQLNRSHTQLVAMGLAQ